MGRDVCAKRLVPRVADSLADLCAGERAGSVEFGLAFVVAVRISCAVRARGSSVRALNLHGLGVAGSCFAGWSARAVGFRC